MNDNTQPQWRTLDEVAADLRVPVDAVQRLVTERRLEAVRVGEALRVRSSALEAYLARASTARPRWPRAARAAAGVAALAVVVGAVVVGAQSVSVDNGPHLLPYRGVLEQSGANVQSDTVRMAFQLYTAPTGGDPLVGWSEEQTVAVQDGQFSVAIGANTPIPSSFFTQPNLYLQVAVNGQQLTGRQRLLAVPYAQSAATATNVVGAGTVNTAAVSAATVSASTAVSAPTFSTPYLNIADRISGGNTAGNLHLDSNPAYPDGRIYLNYFANGKGVYVGGGGLQVAGPMSSGDASVGNLTVNGTAAVAGLSVGGVVHRFRQDDCTSIVLPRGHTVMCPDGYYVAGLTGAQSGDWFVYSATCCR